MLLVDSQQPRIGCALSPSAKIAGGADRGGAFMRNVGWLNLRPVTGLLKSLLAAVFAASLLSTPAPAQTASLEDLSSAVVKIKTHINPDGRTVQGLGRDREGTGILIDADGLILTIGYLMVEAYAAEVITNDRRTIPATIVGY